MVRPLQVPGPHLREAGQALRQGGSLLIINVILLDFCEARSWPSASPSWVACAPALATTCSATTCIARRPSPCVHAACLPACRPARITQPALALPAAALQIDSVVIAKMDGTENEHPDIEASVRGIERQSYRRHVSTLSLLRPPA